MVHPIDLSVYGYSILQIETFVSCDMKCSFCAFPLRKDKGFLLEDEMVYELIDAIDPNDKFEHVCLSHYNEPLLDKRIFKFIRYANDRKVPTLLITNGTHFQNPDCLNELVAAEPSKVKISLQTLNKTIFKKARGIDMDFKKYTAGVISYLNAVIGKTTRVTIDVGCNYMPPLKRILRSVLGLEHGDPSMYNTVQALRNDVVSFFKNLMASNASIKIDFNKLDEYLEGAPSDYLEQSGFSVAQNVNFKIKRFIYGRRLADFFPVRSNIKCGTRILGILASGNVMPCCLGYGDMFGLGNIKKEALHSILERNKSVFERIHSGINKPIICNTCFGAPTLRGQFFKRLLFRLTGNRA